MRATPPTVLRATTSRIASGSPRNRCDCTVWIVRRPSRRAHSQALAAGAIWERPLCAASSPWIFGTIVSAAAHSPTRCRIARLLLAIGGMLLGLWANKLLATLEFARIVSALVVVVGVTSRLGSGAALSPRRRVGLRAWVLTIAQRCYDCEERCSQSFDF